MCDAQMPAMAVPIGKGGLKRILRGCKGFFGKLSRKGPDTTPRGFARKMRGCSLFLTSESVVSVPLRPPWDGDPG